MLFWLIKKVRDIIVFLLKVLLIIFDKHPESEVRPLFRWSKLKKESSSQKAQHQLCGNYVLRDYLSPQIPHNIASIILERIYTINMEHKHSYGTEIACLLVILYEQNYLATPFVIAISDLFKHLQIPLKECNVKPSRYSSLNYKGNHLKAYTNAQEFLLPLLSVSNLTHNQTSV